MKQANLVVADRVRGMLGDTAIDSLARRIGAVGDCPTCGQQLGTRTVALVAHPMDRQRVAVTAHHADCTASAWHDNGATVVPPMTYRARALTVPLVSGPDPNDPESRLLWLNAAQRRMTPRERRRGFTAFTVTTVMVNPTAESFILRLDRPGTAVDTESEHYREWGLRPLGDLDLFDPLTRLAATITDSTVTVVVPQAGAAWETDITGPMPALARQQGGVLLVVGTECDPDRLDIMAAVTDLLESNQVMTGWVGLAEPAEKEHAAQGTGAPSGVSGYLHGGEPVSDIEGVKLSNQIADLDTEGRALFADDPAVGLGSVITDITSDGEPYTDDTTEEIPVALFEPRQTIVLHDADDTNPPTEYRTDQAQRRGMQPFGYGAVNVTGLPGWSLRRTDTGLAVHDADGNLFATATLDLEPRWISAAVAQRWVLVLYGIRLGARVPEGLSTGQYTTDHRCEEFTESRRQGLVVGGLIRWHGAARH